MEALLHLPAWQQRESGFNSIELLNYMLLLLLFFSIQLSKVAVVQNSLHFDCRNLFASPDKVLRFLPPFWRWSFPTEHTSITRAQGGWNITCVAWIVSLGGRKEGGRQNFEGQLEKTIQTEANIFASIASKATPCFKEVQLAKKKKKSHPA